MTKKKVTFTDMAIWVDANILKPDVDEAKVYKYLKKLAYMLSMKKRYFRNYEDYDMFADYMATIVYMRMTTKNQYLPKDHPKYRSPIKSCLNYMKGILYARKCAYEYENYRQSTKEEVEFNTARDYFSSDILNNNSGLLELDVELYLNRIESIVKNVLSKGPYTKDRVLYWKIYTSVIISLLNNFTLSNANRDKLAKKGFFSTDIVWKEKYDSLVSQIIEEESETAGVVYDLDESYLDYVIVTVQKVKKSIANDIKELINEYVLPDQLVEDMLMSGLSKGENNEV